MFLTESLKGTVFPWVDEDMANFERDSSSYEGEVVCKGFLRLMQYMKIVFLQDSALVRRVTCITASIEKSWA